MLVTTEQEYQKLLEGKFSVLDAVRSVVTEDGVAATLSIGVGKDVDDYETLYQNAMLSIEMALSRGGDQVVVRNRLDFEFYGGKSKSTEKRTKVKSRVMANALGELISDAGQIFVMGHKHADMDAVGAAAGICCIARKRGKKAQIVVDMEDNVAKPILAKLAALPEYKDVFISGSDAFISAQPGALLVVVDTCLLYTSRAAVQFAALPCLARGVPALHAANLAQRAAQHRALRPAGERKRFP